MSICEGERKFTLVSSLNWYTVGKAGRPPSPALTLCIVSVCSMDVENIFLWNYLGKLWDGKCAKEMIIMRKNKDARHYQTRIRDTLSFLVEIPYLFIKAILLQKVVLCTH